MVADGGGVDVCLVDPGYEVDVVVDVALDALTRIWMGDTTWTAERQAGHLDALGPARLVGQLPDWIGQHPVLAPVGRVR